MGALTRFILEHPEHSVEVQSMRNDIIRECVSVTVRYPAANLANRSVMTVAEYESDEYLSMVLYDTAKHMKKLADEKMIDALCEDDRR